MFKNKKTISLFLSLTMICSFFIFPFTVSATPSEDNTTVVTENVSETTINISDADKMVEDEFRYLDYFDKNLPQRASSSQNEKNAADYIKSELEGFGYEVKTEPFSFTLKSKKYSSQNVVTTKKGVSSDKQIIIGAHYDSVQTAGIGDNASGVSLVLSYAKVLSKLNPRYDVKIVFFGSEEQGKEGSKAYVKAMSKAEIQKTILMINADTIMAGTYCYVYGGTKKSNGQVIDRWGADLAKDIANRVKLDLRFNDTPISTYTPPTAVDRSDHISFQNVNIPYVYFEATNWELPDNPDKPKLGSTGDYETEIGKFKQNPDRDNLTAIMQNFGERAKNNMKTYSAVLPRLVERAMTRAYVSNFLTLDGFDDMTGRMVDTEFAYLDYFDRNLPQRYSSSQNEKNAADYIQSELESFGYEVQQVPFEFDLKEQHYPSQNVVTKKKGSSDERQIVIGAHYDSVQTSGIGNNASGVALLLSYARELAKLQPQYDVNIVFFGSEELGMQGSKAYVDSMSKAEKEKTIVMINADAIMAGTYCYVYGGTKNSKGEVVDSWGADLAKDIANSLNLDLRFNDTPISTYTPPTAVEHSDHASFQAVNIPYIFFEATNWELPDDPNNPDAGSTGDYETELGKFMHDINRDHLESILQSFGERPKNNMKTYSELLPKVIEQSMTKAYNGEIPLNTIADIKDNTEQANSLNLSDNLPLILAAFLGFIIFVVGLVLIITTVKKRRYRTSMKVVRRKRTTRNRGRRR